MKLGRSIEVKFIRHSLEKHFIKNQPRKDFELWKVDKILIDTLFKDHFVKSQFRSIKTFDLIFKRNHPKNWFLVKWPLKRFYWQSAFRQSDPPHLKGVAFCHGKTSTRLYLQIRKQVMFHCCSFFVKFGPNMKNVQPTVFGLTKHCSYKDEHGNLKLNCQNLKSRFVTIYPNEI